MMLRHLDLRLDLTDAQHAQIGRILEQRHARMRNELDATNAEIEKVLSVRRKASRDPAAAARPVPRSPDPATDG